MSFLDECRRLVGIDSTPRHGNLAAAEFVAQLCQDAGLYVDLQRESVEGSDQCNVIARPAPGGVPEREILYQTHLDTVEPGHFSQWTKTQSNPFNASIYGDVIYGLGSADVKLDFLCKLAAIREMREKTLRTPFVLVGTFGGENGMSGAIKLMRRKKLNASHAFVGEPTGQCLVIAGQGLAVVEISIPYSAEERAYRRDHDMMESSSSQSRIFSSKGGVNAIHKMLAYLAQLPEGIAVMDLDGGINPDATPATSVLEIDMVAGFHDPILPKISQIYLGLIDLEKVLQAFAAEGFDPPHPTMNLGVIRTSEAEVTIRGTCRLPPSVTDAVYEGWMQKLEQAVQQTGATFRVKEYRRGFTTDPNSDFVRATQQLLRDMNLDPTLHKLSFATEASVLSRLGIECLVWGPGQGLGNSQAPNECVKVSELKAATEFYRRSLERFCL